MVSSGWAGAHVFRAPPTCGGGRFFFPVEAVQRQLPDVGTVGVHVHQDGVRATDPAVFSVIQFAPFLV